MSEVTFQEEQGFPASHPTSPQKSTGLIGLVLKTGLAKTEKEANVILIIIAVCALAATVFVLMSGPRSSGPTPEDLQIINDMRQSGSGAR
jgi:hypothetical protein